MLLSQLAWCKVYTYFLFSLSLIPWNFLLTEELPADPGHIQTTEFYYAIKKTEIMKFLEKK